jgi:hypothetical protein
MVRRTGRSVICPGGDANRNVYDADGRYAHWFGTNLTGYASLGQWRNNTGGKDADSKECAPTYRDEDEMSLDLHLDPSDTCAMESGENRSNITTIDADGDPRPATGAWDAGADEYGTYIFSDGFESGNLTAWCAVIF